jgi:hypothetical protein
MVQASRLAKETNWPLVSSVSFLVVAVFIVVVLFILGEVIPNPKAPLPIVGFFSFVFVLVLYYSITQCPSCGRRFAAKLLGEKGANAFQILFQEGEAPPLPALRSAVAAKLAIDENDVFVELKYDVGARVALSKNFIPFSLPARELTIWERNEIMKWLERTLSELDFGMAMKVGDSAKLGRWECKTCGHTWTKLDVCYND